MTAVKKISLKKYNAIMDKIIKKNLSVEDTLTEMLEEASKYVVVELSLKDLKEKKNGN